MAAISGVVFGNLVIAIWSGSCWLTIAIIATGELYTL